MQARGLSNRAIAWLFISLTIALLLASNIFPLDVGGERCHALLRPGAEVRAGENVSVRARPGAVLYFDADGRRVAVRSEAGSRSPEARGEEERADVG